MKLSQVWTWIYVQTFLHFVSNAWYSNILSGAYIQVHKDNYFKNISYIVIICLKVRNNNTFRSQDLVQCTGFQFLNDQ